VEKIYEKVQRPSEWKDELTIRMDFPVCGVITILHISSGVMYTHTQILYTKFIPPIVFEIRSRK
jgi:hypothetical protein